MSISDLQNDTSGAETNREELTSLSEISRLSKRAPFDALQDYLENVSPFHSVLGSNLLNELTKIEKNRAYKVSDDDYPVAFVDQSAMQLTKTSATSNTENLYYEAFIYEHKLVPTRGNWHDFYNGLIWLQFGQTKAYFNALHQQQMQMFGRKNRTAVRDRLTHFDECGLLLITDQSGLEDEIAAHNWQQVFVERKSQWHQQIKPIIFGHALWEMLMQPFIGLTAKVTIIENEKLLHAIGNCRSVPSQASAEIDQHLLKHLQNTKLIKQAKPWMPLPLLGIPNWSHMPQTAEFYANTAYFMPKRSVVKNT